MTRVAPAPRASAATVFANEKLQIEPSPRWVRAFFAGVAVVDSKRPLLMREGGHTPVYYFPRGDVRTDLLVDSDHRTHCPHKGDARYWSVRVGDRLAENAVWCYPEPAAGAPDLSEWVALYWHTMDAWFEEDDQVYVHPRDPYKRVDVLNSSRHVRVLLSGEVLGETRRPRLLFETGLPTRYYMPKMDVRLDRLSPSATRTRCPYKGEAHYYSARVSGEIYEDIAWYYPYPVPECPRIENLVCFYNERVGELWVDGELMPKPRTRWS
jgi:uncharacterized protein (DUF427 family)